MLVARFCPNSDWVGAMASEVSIAGAQQDLRRSVAELERELGEAQQREAATAELLQVISIVLSLRCKACSRRLPKAQCAFVRGSFRLYCASMESFFASLRRMD